MIEFALDGFNEAAAAISTARFRLSGAMTDAVNDIGKRLHGDVRSFAPVDSGRFRDSWQWQLEGPYSGWVGTNAPQAWRLERGFYGTDRLGRTYNQAPKPSLGPAIEAVSGDVPEILWRRMNQAWS